jgi:hypothetical protein
VCFGNYTNQCAQSSAVGAIALRKPAQQYKAAGMLNSAMLQDSPSLWSWSNVVIIFQAVVSRLVMRSAHGTSSVTAS